MPKPGRSRSQNTASRCSTDNASTVRLVITRSWRLGMAFPAILVLPAGIRKHHASDCPQTGVHHGASLAETQAANGN